MERVGCARVRPGPSFLGSLRNPRRFAVSPKVESNWFLVDFPVDWSVTMIVAFNRKKFAARGGAAAVEFAVVVPVFFLIFFGIVEIGRAFMVRGILDNAARAGCRTGILQGKSNTDVTSAVTSA